MKAYRKVLGFGLLVGLLIGVADLMVAPLHRAGWGQGVGGFFLGGVHLLNLPGYTIAGAFGLWDRHQWTWRGFAVATPVSMALWTVVAAAFAQTQQLSGNRTSSTGVSRRKLLAYGGRAIAAAGAGAAGWGIFGEARWFEVTRRRLAVTGLAPELNGLRIVQLSDLHHSPWMSIGWVRDIIETTNDLAPDVVALTGDYVYRGPEYIRPAVRELARLRARVGVVGVMGNHDWWEDGQLTRRAFAEVGLPLIDNSRMFVTPGRRLVDDAREGLCLAGVGDLWEDRCDYGAALDAVPGGVPRILLSHNPDVAEEPDFLQSGYRVDLMLSGHTHGGQVSVPGLGAPVTNSRFGQKYAKGLVAGPACPVFISRGLGMTVMPVRWGVRPEIAVIELESA